MFDSYEEVQRFIAEFEACRLPKPRWTHQAHLVAGFWYARRQQPAAALATIRERILRHNESVGTANTDSSGYHETLTRLYMGAIAAQLADHAGCSFEEQLARMLASPLSVSTWPLQFYTKERLFSVQARREWVEPDLQPAPGMQAL